MGRPDASLPAWVLEARRRLEGRTGRRRPAFAVGPPRPGDLRLALPFEDAAAERRLVCVLDTDHGAATVRAALVSNEVDVATGAGLLAPAATTGLPFDLVILSDIVGTLCWSQVPDCVGRVDRRLAELLRGAAADGVAGVPRRARGMPIVTADDCRCELTAHEHEQMRRLGGPPHQRSVPLVVDPAVVTARPGDDGRVYSARLEAVAVELAATTDAIIPRAVVPAVLAAWDRGLAVSPDAWRGLQPYLERALSGCHGSGGSGATFDPSRRPADASVERALAEACGRQAGLGATAVRLLTTPEAWADDLETSTLPATAVVGDIGAVRIIRHHVEVSQ